jgi:hypothetical protein
MATTIKITAQNYIDINYIYQQTGNIENSGILDLDDNPIIITKHDQLTVVDDVYLTSLPRSMIPNRTCFMNELTIRIPKEENILIFNHEVQKKAHINGAIHSFGEHAEFKGNVNIQNAPFTKFAAKAHKGIKLTDCPNVEFPKNWDVTGQLEFARSGTGVLDLKNGQGVRINYCPNITEISGKINGNTTLLEWNGKLNATMWEVYIQYESEIPEIGENLKLRDSFTLFNTTTNKTDEDKLQIYKLIPIMNKCSIPIRASIVETLLKNNDLAIAVKQLSEKTINEEMKYEVDPTFIKFLEEVLRVKKELQNKTKSIKQALENPEISVN